MTSRYKYPGDGSDVEASIKLGSRVMVIVYDVVNVVLAREGLSATSTDADIIKTLAMAFYERMPHDP